MALVYNRNDDVATAVVISGFKSLPLILQTLGEVWNHQDEGHPLSGLEVHTDRGCNSEHSQPLSQTKEWKGEIEITVCYPKKESNWGIGLGGPLPQVLPQFRFLLVTCSTPFPGYVSRCVSQIFFRSDCFNFLPVFVFGLWLLMSCGIRSGFSDLESALTWTKIPILAYCLIWFFY